MPRMVATVIKGTTYYEYPEDADDLSKASSSIKLDKDDRGKKAGETDAPPIYNPAAGSTMRRLVSPDTARVRSNSDPGGGDNTLLTSTFLDRLDEQNRQIETLHTQLEKKNLQALSKEQEIRNLKVSMGVFVSRTGQGTADRDRQIRDLQKSLAQAKQQGLTQENKVIQGLQAKLNVLHSDREWQVQRSDHLRTELEHLRTQKDHATIRIGELSRSLETLKVESTQESIHQDTSIRGLEDQIATLIAEKDKFSQKINGLETLNDGLNDLTEEYSRQKSEAERKFKDFLVGGKAGREARARERQAKIDGLEAELVKKEDALAKAQGEIQSLEADLKELEKENKKLIAQENAANTARKASEQQLKPFQRKVDALNKRVAELKSEISNLKKSHREELTKSDRKHAEEMQNVRDEGKQEAIVESQNSRAQGALQSLKFVAKTGLRTIEQQAAEIKAAYQEDLMAETQRANVHIDRIAAQKNAEIEKKDKENEVIRGLMNVYKGDATRAGKKLKEGQQQIQVLIDRISNGDQGTETVTRILEGIRDSLSLK